MAFIKTKDGIDLYCKRWGTGRPVVLIHGWPLSSSSWDDVSVALADAGMCAISYDRRGFGYSEQPSNGYDYDTLADDLAAVIEETGAQDAAIVGFSMGGGEVARYMSRHGGRNVSSAVLISSVVPYMLKTADNPDGTDQDVFDEMTSDMKEDRPKFFGSFLKTFFGVGMISHPTSDEQVHAAWVDAMRAGLKPTLECAKAFAMTDFRSDLPSFKVPTLIIHGTSDKTVPIDGAGRAAAQQIANSTLLEYDGAPHGLYATHKQQLIDDLIGFLRK